MKFPTFYLTFGQNHELRDSWIEIRAENVEEAHKLAFQRFGSHWAFLYAEGDFDKSYFPRGRAGRIEYQFGIDLRDG